MSLAFTSLSTGKAIADISDLMDACDATATPSDSLLIQATAALVPETLVTQNPDGTYSIHQQPLTSISTTPICTDSPFYGESTFVTGRSGVLIGADLVMTAPHSSSWDPRDYYVIFGLTRPTPWSQECGVNFLSIPAANVYTPVTDVLFDGNDIPDAYLDYGYFQLDRPVSSRQPLRIRRSGKPAIGDRMIVAGHPMRLGMKFDTAGTYVGTGEAGNQGHSGPLIHNIHTIGGSSGSPIFNATEEFIEAVVSWGPAGMRYHFDPTNQCYRLTEEHITFATNGEIKDIDASIPGDELRVYPLDQVVHEVLIGQSLPNEETTYQIAPAIPNTLAWLQIDSANSSGGVDGPSLTADAPDDVYQVLMPTPLNVEAEISSVISCGVWDLDINVIDYDTGSPNRLRHRFEVSMTETDILPADGWIIRDLGTPYPNSNTYSVANVRATPADVSILSSAPWLKLLEVESNGQPVSGAGNPANTLQMNLTGEGGSGATRYFRMEIDPAAALNLKADKEYQARVTISHDVQECAISPSAQRDVTFVRGRQVFEFPFNPQGFLQPPAAGSSYSPPVEYELDFAAQNNLLIQSVGVEIPFFIFSHSIQTILSFLKIELESPDGNVEILWDKNSIPSGSPYIGYEPDLGLQTLRIANPSMPPLGGGNLVDFHGRLVEGTWKIRFYTAEGFEPFVNMVAPWQSNLTLTADY